MGLSADCVLADAFLIPPYDTAHNYKEGKGSSKKVWKLVTEKQFTSKMKKGDVGIVKNASLRSTETRDELSTTCNLNKKMSQDACQCLILHPHNTASRTSSQN